MVDLSDPDVIETIFKYHAPEGDMAVRYVAKEFVKVLVANTP